MRKLPVLQDATTDDALAASRPPWQWVLIGAGFALTLWAPLAAIAVPLLPRLGALPVLLSFGIAAGAAGALLGRFGGRSRRREAALAGLVAAAVAASLAVLGARLPAAEALAGFSVLGAAGALFAGIGAGFGLRRR